MLPWSTATCECEVEWDDDDNNDAFYRVAREGWLRHLIPCRVPIQYDRPYAILENISLRLPLLEELASTLDLRRLSVTHAKLEVDP